MVSCGLGASRKLRHLAARAGLVGKGVAIGTTGARSSSAISSEMTRPSRPWGSYSRGTSLASSSSRRSRGDTSITRLVSPSEGQTPGSMWMPRVLTEPTILTACGTVGGVQTARSGGATQAPCGVLTTTTPLAA